MIKNCREIITEVNLEQIIKIIKIFTYLNRYV